MMSALALTAAAAAAAVLLLCCAAPEVSAAQDAFGVPGDYDSYVLAMSWTPEYCFNNKQDPECTNIKPTDFAAKNFGLHGLWPQYNTTRKGHDWPQVRK